VTINNVATTNVGVHIIYETCGVRLAGPMSYQLDSGSVNMARYKITCGHTYIHYT